MSYPNDGRNHDQNSYGQDSYGQDSYNKDSYNQNTYSQDAHTRSLNYQQGNANYQQGYDQSYGQGYSDQNYSGQNYSGQNYSGQNYSGSAEFSGTQQDQSGLIAGRFETKKVISNLVLLAVLGAVVTFAVVFLVDILVAQFTEVTAGGVPTAVLTAVVAGLIGIGAALLYIPVSGTGNEHLFGIAVIALAVVATVLWVLLGGLLDGEWGTLVTLAGIICTATIAYATPSRIESASVY